MYWFECIYALDNDYPMDRDIRCLNNRSQELRVTLEVTLKMTAPGERHVNVDTTKTGGRVDGRERKLG